MSKLKVKLIKSPIGFEGSQRKTCEALGLRRLQRTRMHDDNAVIRGMINKVRHLVEVEKVDSEEVARATA